MDGFIQSYSRNFGSDLSQGATIMKCFSPDHVTAITNLTMEFGVIDGKNFFFIGFTD